MLGTHGSLRWPHGEGGRKGSEEPQTEEKPGGREGLEGPREFGNWGNWSNWDNRSIGTLKTVFERKSLLGLGIGKGRRSTGLKDVCFYPLFRTGEPMCSLCFPLVQPRLQAIAFWACAQALCPERPLAARVILAFPSPPTPPRPWGNSQAPKAIRVPGLTAPAQPLLGCPAPA